jgi:sterol desaturase/sphingolipid hydroxylase (fatty acid hydroxylase superfamily)
MSPLRSVFGHHAEFIIIFGGLGFMTLEYIVGRLAHHDEAYDFAESATSLTIAVGRHFVKAAEAGLIAVPFAFVYAHRLFSFSAASGIAIFSLFIATEFAYYWQHRFSHRIRWLWATHAVHHSPTRLNMSAAIRIGWTGNITGSFVFFLPLAYIGFHPFAVIGMLGANLLYQFFIHTEFARNLGPLEWILNTPAHHRVHHASNASCLDKNFGGVLIIFDRLFGTFAQAPKDESLRYGLVDGARILNPVRIIFGEWTSILNDFKAARSLRGKLNVLLGPPGGNAEEPHSERSRSESITRASIENSAVTLIYPGE